MARRVEAAIAQACWWCGRFDLHHLECPSTRLDPTIESLPLHTLRQHRDLRGYLEAHGIPALYMLGYQAMAEGPYGIVRLAALFPLNPFRGGEPEVFALNGDRRSLHRNNGESGNSAHLCLYFPGDPDDRRWTPEYGLVELFDLARRHLACEQRLARDRRVADRGRPAWQRRSARRPAARAQSAAASRVGTGGQVAMPYKPFLSHKHEEAHDMELLRDELRLRGAGGWQDATDLRVGQRWEAAFKRAIGRETGGFILWGTRAALTSRTICRVEVPSALRRARSSRHGAYPVVPMFVDLDPGRDADDIKTAFGRRRGKRRGEQLLDLHGVIREKDEQLADFSRRAARRYVRDLIREHDGPELRIAVTGGRPPSGNHDLSLDWRGLLDPAGRVTDATVLPTFLETLADIRDAVHDSHDCPHLIVEPHVRLPLGALIGWEWNRVRPVKLTVVQPSGRGFTEVPDLPGDPTAWTAPAVTALTGNGPAVLAVSVGKNLGDSVRRYAEAQSAREAMHLHVDLDHYPDRVLPAEAICSLAEWTVARLAELNMRAVPKHLLLLGPASLAVRIGAAAGGTGTTFVPFWDGDTGYTSGVIIG